MVTMPCRLGSRLAVTAAAWVSFPLPPPRLTYTMGISNHELETRASSNALLDLSSLKRISRRIDERLHMANAHDSAMHRICNSCVLTSPSKAFGKFSRGQGTRNISRTEECRPARRRAPTTYLTQNVVISSSHRA